jgi:sugar phosphate isomerase/epimerase
MASYGIAMKLSLVLSTHAAQFQAVALKGDFELNVARIAAWGYDGVELAIRDPSLVDADELIRTVSAHGLQIPAIGTGQAWASPIPIRRSVRLPSSELGRTFRLLLELGL